MSARIILAALFLVAGISAAQASGQTSAPLEILCSPLLCKNTKDATYNDGTDVGRAMAICEAHRDHSMMTTPETIEYGKDWQACHKIRALWEKSDAARKQREAEAKEKADKAFVESVAKKARP